MPVFHTIASVFPKRRSDAKYEHFSRSRPIKINNFFRLTKNSQICLVCADYPQISRCRQGKCVDFAEIYDISHMRVIKLTTQSLHTVNKTLVERDRNRRICVFRRWQGVWHLRNIVVLLPLGRSQYSLFLHLFRVPSSAPGSGTLIRLRTAEKQAP